MRWGPVRGMALGGVLFGILVLIVGILLLLVNQKIITIVLDWFTLCSIGLILLGVVIIGGTVWGLRMARGGWRKWVEDWDHDDRDRQM